MFTKARSIISTVLISAFLLGSTGPLYARDRDHDRDRDRDRDRHDTRGRHPGPDRWYGPVHRGPIYVVPRDRYRVYRNIRIFRPYGHWYPGYGWYHNDDSALRFLAFTAITMVILNELNESQERALETAQIKATTAPVGETIDWTQGNARGSVVATREGTSSTGRYCREFQQTVTVGGKSQQAYGTACQQPDGTWEIVSTGDSQ